jgi:hypothetical protein
MLYLEPPPETMPGGLLARLRRPPKRQANASVTGDLPAGRLPLVVRAGTKIAGQTSVEIKR